jgi:LSD1 subclass zinc finger protein
VVSKPQMYYNYSGAMSTDPNTERTILRHLLATMTYRATRTFQNAPSEFGTFRAHGTSRTPVQILSHMADLCDWALSMVKGAETWRDAVPQHWDAELSRFYSSVRNLEDYLAGPSHITCSVCRLIQGPIADAIAHVGQLAMLRRISGNPTHAENFYKADIEAGQVGPNQPAPRKLLD